MFLPFQGFTVVTRICFWRNLFVIVRESLQLSWSRREGRGDVCSNGDERSSQFRCRRTKWGESNLWNTLLSTASDSVFRPTVKDLILDEDALSAKIWCVGWTAERRKATSPPIARYFLH